MSINEQFQKEVFEDFKSIVKDLNEVQSFSGLLMHQQKIQNLYEKYIFLKQLNISKYQQLLEKTFEGDSSEVLQRDFFPESQPDATSVTVENRNVEEKKEEVATPENKPEPEASEQVQEKLSPISIDIAEIKPAAEKEHKLRPIQLDFNDSIAFISQLFNGNKAAMDEELKKLNETKNMSESRAWIEEMFHKYNWKDKEEYVERLSGLILNRFE